MLGVSAVERARDRRPDRCRRGARHGRRLGKRWRSASSCRAVALGEAGAQVPAASAPADHSHQLACRRLAWQRSVPSLSRRLLFVLWLMIAMVRCICAEPEVEAAGLDVSEHGMWGYPESHILVPGGYGTESHGHLGPAHAKRPVSGRPLPRPRRSSLRDDIGGRRTAAPHLGQAISVRPLVRPSWSGLVGPARASAGRRGRATPHAPPRSRAVRARARDPRAGSARADRRRRSRPRALRSG